MQVTNNVASYNVWRNYTNNVAGLRNSMSKLSSGSRINTAGDDPSGLAMSERLRAQTRNTAAAASNVENKLSYLQTADSWMQKMQDMLGRMGELAVMANDGTKSDTDKGVLQKEFAQMQAEIERITTGDPTGDGSDAAAQFNGITLFQSTAGITQQVGADGGQEFTGTGSTFDLSSDQETKVLHTVGSGSGATSYTWGDLINSDDSTVTNLVDVSNASGGSGAAAAVSVVNAGIDYISESRAGIGAEMKRMNQTLDGLRSYQENITSTESRIRDVDVAKETAEMSKYNILQQVGTAMLAQANQLPQGVLQLLG